jgi:DNA-binding PadR family transcriptional regulator
MSTRTPLESHLPLKPVDFHILLVLTEGDLHGYGVVKQIEAQTEGGIRLEPGNLYRYLRRLVDERMVEPADRRAVRDAAGERPSVSGTKTRADERRRYYRVTSYGREVLAAEALRMRSLVAAAEAGLVIPGAGQ